MLLMSLMRSTPGFWIPKFPSRSPARDDHAGRPAASSLSCRGVQDAPRPRKGPSPPVQSAVHNSFDLLSARRADAGGSREEIVMTEPRLAAASASVAGTAPQTSQAAAARRPRRRPPARQRVCAPSLPHAVDRGTGLALADAQFVSRASTAFRAGRRSCITSTVSSCPVRRRRTGRPFVQSRLRSTRVITLARWRLRSGRYRMEHVPRGTRRRSGPGEGARRSPPGAGAARVQLHPTNPLRGTRGTHSPR